MDRNLEAVTLREAIAAVERNRISSGYLGATGQWWAYCLADDNGRAIPHEATGASWLEAIANLLISLTAQTETVLKRAA